MDPPRDDRLVEGAPGSPAAESPGLMRIALLCCNTDIVYGDGRRCPPRLRGLSSALAAAGHEVSAIVAGVHPELPPHTQPSVRALRLPVTVREIDWHLSRIEPDVVIERLGVGSREGAQAAAEAGVPHLYDIDLPAGDLPADLGEMLALSMGAIVADERIADVVRARSPEGWPVGLVADAAEPKFLAEPDGELLRRLAATLRLNRPELRIGYYGDLACSTGARTLLEAAGPLAKERPVRVLAYGDGAGRNEALAAAHAAGVPLTLCGSVEIAQRPACLALCDIVVVPTLKEPHRTLPLSALEALAAARVVVLPAAGGELSGRPEGLTVVPPDDAPALGAALAALAQDADDRFRAGAAGRDYVAQHATWGVRVAEVCAFVQPLLMSRRELPR